MHKRALSTAMAAIGLLLTTTPALAQMGGARGADAIVPPHADSDDDRRVTNIGEYHPGEYLSPISLARFDKAVSALFARADVNHDGMITLAEFDALISARRNEAIVSRFHQIDTNHDGAVSLAEFTAWQQDMGSAAASQCTTYAARIVPDTLAMEPGNNDRDEALADVVEPLSDVLITRANIHYRAGITLDDLLAYEHKRFDAVDTNHDGFLEQGEIEALRRAARAH